MVIYLSQITTIKINIMSNKTKEFSNWLENMTFGFENDFLNVNKSNINDLLIDNDIDILE